MMFSFFSSSDFSEQVGSECPYGYHSVQGLGRPAGLQCIASIYIAVHTDSMQSSVCKVHQAGLAWHKGAHVADAAVLSGTTPTVAVATSTLIQCAQVGVGWCVRMCSSKLSAVGFCLTHLVADRRNTIAG